MEQVERDFMYGDKHPNNRGSNNWSKLARDQEKAVFETDPVMLGQATEDSDMARRNRRM